VNPVLEHPKVEQLTAFLCGKLDSVDQEAIGAHVAACDRCCQALREIPDDKFVALLKDANAVPETGDGRHYGSLNRDLSLPMELRKHPRYKIGKFLGSGGMGLVYQAEHRMMDRIVALKILHHDLIQNPRIVKRFRQEVKAAARLLHPNIVTAYDADQAGDAHFLVMEYVDGVSLYRLVAKRGPLEVAYAAYFIRQAAKGLEHAFQQGMVHRDIKPQNLMLTRKGQVKILDFGLARLAAETRTPGDFSLASAEGESPEPSDADAEGLTNLGDVMGTPDYMAPEQAIDASAADIRADIYSLGCTMYYLLTGKTPFETKSIRAKVFAQKYSQPRPITKLRDDLPASLVQIIEKMMAKDPQDRYQTPTAVVKALAPFAKPTPMAKSVPFEAPPAPAQKPAQTQIATPPVVEAAGKETQNFLARCPFCLTRIRIPARALGASLPCPHCSSYFTSVPEDEGSGPR